MATNVFVGAYIDRLFENKLLRGPRSDGDERNRGEGKGKKKAQRIFGALTFEDFVHVFWVFSNSAPRSEKEEGECAYVVSAVRSLTARHQARRTY